MDAMCKAGQRCAPAAFGLALIEMLVPGPAAWGQVLVRSSFDAGAEGWTVSQFAAVCVPMTGATSAGVTWTADGGAPGGYLRTTDPSGSRSSFWRAPASFRAALADAAGGSVRMEQRLNVGTAADQIYNATDDVVLVGAGLTLFTDAVNVSRDAWGQTEVPLRAGFWRVGSCSGPVATEAQLNAVLAGATDLFIRAEYHNGNESNDLDSVEIDATPSETDCVAVWEQRDDVGPSGRWRHAVAVDPVNRVLVLFGGDTGEAETWEYSLTTGVWERIETASSPTRRGGHAMAYDAARGRVVMTGGGYLGVKSEVWEYDAAADTWTLSTPLPQGRSGHAMAFDSDRNVMVLYGGLDDTVAGALAVLERGPGSADWIVRDAGVNPGEQFGLSMAYDPSRQRMVAVSRGTTAVRVDEWDGAAGAWELRGFTGSLPGARDNPVIVYDPSVARIVLMGGEGNATTWTYDGTAWLRRADIPGGGRDEHAAGYDTVNGRILLSGGLRGTHTPQRDLLTYDADANQWSTAWSRSDCGARELLGMIYDEAGGRVVAYGGALRQRAGIVEIADNRTFLLQGGGWSTAAVTGNPGARRQLAPVYDPFRRVMMVYGGANDETAASANARLWELDLATLAWTDRGPQAPGQRYDTANAFDLVRRRLVVHGGVNELGQRIGGTWIYDPAAAAWSTLPAGATDPGVRSGAGCVFDEHRGVVVLFGGRLGTDRYDNSTWEWNGAEWRNVTPASGNPPARVRPRLVYDPQRRTVVMLGGTMNFNSSSDPVVVGRAYEDLWEWNGSTWRRLAQAPGPRPVALASGGTVYDRAAGELIQFGGLPITNGTYRNGQTWSLRLPPTGCGAVCLVDLNGDGVVDFGDYLEFLNLYEAQDPRVDFNQDLMVDFADYLEFLNLYEAGC